MDYINLRPSAEVYFKGGLATDVVLVWQVDHRVVFFVARLLCL